MATFCNSCGATMTGPFCNKCGARAVSAGAPAAAPVQAAPPSQPPPAPPAPRPVAAQVAPAQPSAGAAPIPTPTKSSAGKILLVIGGVLLLLFVIGVAAAMYGVYWVKHKVTAYKNEITTGSSEPVKVVANGNTCKLLSTSDLQQILGVPIEKSAEIMEGDTPGCAYYTNQAAFTQLQRMAAEFAKKQADEVNNRPGPKPDNLPALLKNANQLEGAMKALSLTQPVQDGQVFSFSVQRNSDSQAWSAMKLVEAAVPGFEEVPGVADHAAIGSLGHAFYVQKGDAMLHLNTIWVPDAKTRGSEIAKKIVGNL